MFKFIKSLFMPRGVKTTAGALAKKFGLGIQGDPKAKIESVGSITNARGSQLTFYSTERNSAAFKILPIDVLTNSVANVIVLQPEMVPLAPARATLLISDSPRLDMIKIMGEIYREKPKYGIHFATHIERGVFFRKKKTCYVGQFATIGRGSVIEMDVKIYPGAFIGKNVTIGRGTIIYPNAHIENATIGADCVIGAGAVIGTDGFGYTRASGKNIFIPHVGRVIIGDRVSIGSNTCVDRGAMTDTMIGDGTKIDNLVQIAHGVVIGCECFLAAQVGIAGGCVIGDRVLLGGQTGLNNGVKIGDDAGVGAHSGVLRSIPAGAEYLGYPAGPNMEFMRHYAWLRANTKKTKQGDLK